MKCYQCTNQAIYDTQFGPFCVHCYHKIQQIQDGQNENLERMLNYLGDQMDMVTGFSTGSPRFPERKPPIIHNAPLTVNSINIDRSVIGNVNTGLIDNLEVSMQSITQINNVGAERIKEFTEAVLKEEKLTNDQKEEIIQQLEFIGQQLNIAIEKRNNATIKSVTHGIVSLINFSASLMTLWDPVKKLIQ